MFPNYKDKDKCKNFAWYSNQLLSMNIPVPEFKNSKYLSKEDRVNITSDRVEDLN